MTAITRAPDPSAAGNDRRLNPSSPPSFEIKGAVGVSVAPPRWDRINSAEVISAARRIYFHHLEHGGSAQEPSGIVISALEGQHGRVVFEPPVLLPGEHYLPLELLRTRSGRTRNPRPFIRG